MHKKTLLLRIGRSGRQPFGVFLDVAGPYIEPHGSVFFGGTLSFVGFEGKLKGNHHFGGSPKKGQTHISKYILL